MAYNSSFEGTEVDAAITKSQAMPAFTGEAANYAALPGSPSSGDVVLVRAATTGFDAGFYRYSGSAWVYMGNTRQDADDIDDTSTTHRFTTAADISRLSNTSGTNTGDQDLSTYQLKPSEGAFVNGDKTKLTNIADNADVTNTTNVTNAGALMDSEVTNLAQVKAFSSSDYATAAQGSTADSALQSVAGDSNPTLGANLDLATYDIVTEASNRPIDLAPHGTGGVVLRGNEEAGADNTGKITFNCEANSHGVTIKAPIHSGISGASGSYTLTLPTAVGSNNAVLATTSAGVLSFTNNPTLTTPVVTTLDMAGAIQEHAVNYSSVSGTTALNAANGTIQRWVLSGNVDPTDSLSDGESITIIVDDGSGRTINWTYSGLSVKWIGGSAPTLDTTNETLIVIWQVNSTLYGMTPGVLS